MTDVPEGDAQEQRTPLRDVAGEAEPDIDPEVPEADAFEQAQVVEDDEDDRR